MTTRILIVEDERDIADVIEFVRNVGLATLSVTA